MLFVREFRPISRHSFSSHLFSPSTEERLHDGGDSACGLFVVRFGLCLWSLFFSRSLFFSPPSDCSSLPSTMTWAPCPQGVCTRGKSRQVSPQGDFDAQPQLQKGRKQEGLSQRRVKGTTRVSSFSPGSIRHSGVSVVGNFFCVHSHHGRDASGAAWLCGMPWKRPFLWHNPFNRLHLQVQWHATNRRSISGGHNRRRPAGNGAKRPPPKGGQLSTLWHSKVPNSKQSGVSSRSMKRCTIAKGDRLHARPV